MKTKMRRFWRMLKRWVRPPCENCALPYLPIKAVKEARCSYPQCNRLTLTDSTTLFECAYCHRVNWEGMYVLSTDRYLDMDILSSLQDETYMHKLTEHYVKEEWWQAVRDRGLRVVEPPKIIHQSNYVRYYGMVR